MEEDEEDVDAAIAACLLARGSSATLRALAELGPNALTRWIEVFHGRGRPFDRPAGVTMAGREEVDVWSAMLGELSRTSPEAFLDAVEDGRLPDADTLTVVCLNAIDDPRATAILARATGSGDWLVRYHAVRGLVGRDSDEARAALARARDDPEEMIRREAARTRRSRR